jgi:aryl-alcohol dehydrogenase-like predicted oxidoreductase
MKERCFGKTLRLVSEVGLGCWQLGSDWGKAMNEQEALTILNAAFDAGVTFFDTADVYGDGRSETAIGRFLKSHPGKVFVATKVGQTADLFPDKYTEAGVRAATEASLKRLGVEALELSQLHCVPTGVFRQGDVFHWMRRLKREGKIKNFGASVESMEEGLLCLEQEGLVSLQIIFNIFRQKPITTLFPKAKDKGVAIIVRLPMASGLLSGKLTKESRFPKEDHRNYNCDGQIFNVGETFAGLPLDKGVELADALKPMVPGGMNLAQMALRWILDFDAVTVIIPGASRPDQARMNASASDLPPLNSELHQKLRRFYADEVAAHIRGVY